MDALQMLRNDHRKVKDLFRRFEEAPDASTRKAIVDEAIAELLVHAQLEEEIFYPAMERTGMHSLVVESEEEHKQAENLMNEIAQLDPRSGELAPKFKVLTELVTAHVNEEESEMFPRAAEIGYDRLNKIGDEMAQMKERILTASGKTSKQSLKASTRKSANVDDLTKDELYEQAQKADIEGRSSMNKRELTKALRGK
ncbi:MAG TPA: hemerythrin domain-containing protein [Dehalococcoidia bacterium]|nr:hemerythrin domain-containing protein [Dehalococcoidia bacterium]